MPRARSEDPSLKTLRRQLNTLRSDFRQLAVQVEGLAGNASGQAIDDVKARLDHFGTTVDKIVANASEAGRDAMDAVGEMGGNAVENVENAIRERPLTLLAIAVGVGFILSSAMRR
ncbi:MAG: hypothetical protein EPO23_05700 [Xanthobacteraceae bacterium]|nr:MAG: hypothetical protein EPO23_05700 [Xanthobacteraceae bacterium]